MVIFLVNPKDCPHVLYAIHEKVFLKIYKLSITEVLFIFVFSLVPVLANFVLHFLLILYPSWSKNYIFPITLYSVDTIILSTGVQRQYVVALNYQ